MQCVYVLQADDISEAKEAIQSIVVGELPVTDIASDALVHAETPLENQPDVQNTLETQQQHAAVFSPGVNELPALTPDQIAGVPHGKGMDQWLSKHAKRDEQQDSSSRSDNAGAQSKGANICLYCATCISQLCSCAACRLMNTSKALLQLNQGCTNALLMQAWTQTKLPSHVVIAHTTVQALNQSCVPCDMKFSNPRPLV